MERTNKALGHERVQFTLVGLFSGFKIAAIFSRADPGAKRKETPLTKVIEKFKAQAFPKIIRPLIKPLFKNSCSTNFQGTGPWEGPLHFSRFVLKLHNCSNFFQSWSWVHLPLPLPLPLLLLPLSLFLSVPLPLPLPRPLPVSLLLPVPLPLFLSSSSSSSYSSSSSSSSSSSLSLSLSPSLHISLSLINYTLNKQLKVEKVTQSTCWIPLTTRYYKYYNYYR